MRLLDRVQRFPGWVGGRVEDAEPNVLPRWGITEGENFVAIPAGRQRTRGGSRIVQTLHDDDTPEVELAHVPLLVPFTPTGAVAIGWSSGRSRHYATRLTSDMEFFGGTEAGARTDLSASPSTTWDMALARPVAAELFEKLFIADATVSQASRSEMVSLDSTGTVLRRTFAFAGGSAAAPLPYCLEEYNGVLFIAGYGDEGDKDRPEMLRHSFLGTSPDASGGFDPLAYLVLGAKGQRTTALRKGRGLLLAAKAHEFYRITGFGRAYPGWQYQVESVNNTLGLGIANPHALAFGDDGFWYGIGAQGPLRTDGFAVESLVGPRQRGWRGIDNVDLSWVAYHPERRAMLFGVHPTEAETGRSATYPFVQWVWDLERDVWQTDWKFGADLFMAAAVTTSTAQGPTAKPTSPSTTDLTTSGYTANWVNGDATAETEVWELRQGGGGSWTLVTTVAAGVQLYARTGRLPHQAYSWRVRHRKNGVTTGYTSSTAAKVLMVGPTLTLHTSPIIGVPNTLTIDNTNEGVVDVVLQRDGVDFLTISDMAKGEQTIAISGSHAWRARAVDASWSASPSAYGNTVNS